MFFGPAGTEMISSDGLGFGSGDAGGFAIIIFRGDTPAFAFACTSSTLGGVEVGIWLYL